MRYLFLILLSISRLYAYQAVQDDWSSGSGYHGPDTSWDHNGYYYGVNVDCSSGNVRLNEEGVNQHSIYCYPSTCYALTAADFNGDEYGDIAVCSDGMYNTVQVHFNLDGQGTEWDNYIVSSLKGIMDIEAADIDADGFTDLLFISRTYGDVAWARNNDGLGTDWTTNIIYESIGNGNSVDVADIDGDGDIDVIASGSHLVWIENLGGGQNWSSHIVGSYQGSDIHWGGDATSSDIDLDGDLDIVSASKWNGCIQWYENQLGSSSDWLLHNVALDYDGSSVAVGDINQDGYPDVAATSYTNNEVTVWKNINGMGTSWEEIVVISDYSNPQKVNLADIDNDGDIDIAATCLNATDWWENTDGTGSNLLIHQIASSGANSLRITDINGAGKMDVALVTGSESRWCNLNGHTSGFLFSAWLDVTEPADWGFFSWIDSLENGNSIAFIFRTADENWIPHPWSDTLFTPSSLEGILFDGDRYVLYKAIFECDSFANAASLESVTLSWDITGIDVEDIPDNPLQLLSFSTNPSSTPIVRIELDVAAEVQVSVYSLYGRLVRKVSTGELLVGVNEFTLADLTPGIYFCVMSCSDNSVSKRFVVIE